MDRHGQQPAYRDLRPGRSDERHAVDRQDLLPEVRYGRLVHVPLQDPFDHDGDHHRHPVGSAAARLVTRRVAPDGSSTTPGAGTPARAYNCSSPSSVYILVPWKSSSIWMPQ